MDAARFHASLTGDSPPQGIALLAQALWFDAVGHWDRAHAIVQSQPGAPAAAVHAYLHRKEGDLANADYWYARAGTTRPGIALELEWRRLLEAHLAAGGAAAQAP